MQRNVNGLCEPTNTIHPTVTATKSRTRNSVRSPGDQLRRGLASHRRITGANTTAPAASPSHHVSHTEPYCDHGTKPNHERVVTPAVAANPALSTPAAAKTKMSRPRVRKGYSPANRLTRYAPRTASSALPIAMRIEVVSDPAVVTFVRKAPRTIPGQTRGPKISTAARAMPEGAQTALALAFTHASARPIFP